VARVNARFGSEITVAAFLDAPTVAEVAARLVPEVVAANGNGAAGIEPRVRRGALRRQRREGGGA